MPSISNSSGPYFHLTLLNALMALALTCWLLFSGIDWAPLLDLISASTSPCANPWLSSFIDASSRDRLRTCPLNSSLSQSRIQPALNPISGYMPTPLSFVTLQHSCSHTSILPTAPSLSSLLISLLPRFKATPVRLYTGFIECLRTSCQCDHRLRTRSRGHGG